MLERPTAPLPLIRPALSVTVIVLVSPVAVSGNVTEQPDPNVKSSMLQVAVAGDAWAEATGRASVKRAAASSAVSMPRRGFRMLDTPTSSVHRHPA